MCCIDRLKPQYEEDTVLMIKGKTEPFHHTDRNTLSKIAEPMPNPLAR
jgi:hypothetical protein